MRLTPADRDTLPQDLAALMEGAEAMTGFTANDGLLMARKPAMMKALSALHLQGHVAGPRADPVGGICGQHGSRLPLLQRPLCVWRDEPWRFKRKTGGRMDL